MAKRKAEYLSKTTPDIAQEQIEKLKKVFPECVTEGKVDFDRLRATLGDADAFSADDAYTFTWAGKKKVFRAIQTPSAASLAPAPDESVNWASTRHLFIEGENLEVLKLLYKSYFGKVKMIYIDPPYNTGNDFIYKDDYSQPRKAYLEKTGQIDAEGNVLVSNPETSGRYHSDWLSMMYPRLFLARQLLREDGVIFVSIDDNEVHNLRLLMNEIFGEESLLICFIWHRRQMSDSRNMDRASTDHEYVLCYRKSQAVLRGRDIDLGKYSNPDNDPRGPWFSADITGLATRERRPNLHYDVVDANTGNVFHPSTTRGWSVSKETFEQLILEGRILWPSKLDGRPRRKKFLNEATSLRTGFSSMLDVGFTAEGTREVQELFGDKIIQFPKPVNLVKTLVEQGAPEGGIILDFFAGSCTSAQAIFALNREDGVNRHFIMVQLPEALPEPKTVSDGAVLSTVSEIGAERIRRVIGRMRAEDEEKLDLHLAEDLGFKTFKLAVSTLRQWGPPQGESGESLGEHLALFDRGLVEDANPMNVIYEVILKLGYSLNATIGTLDLESNRVFRVTDEEAQPLLEEEATVSEPPNFYICLDERLEDATISGLALDKETTFVCLDTALDDSQKVNLAMQCILRTI